MKRVLCLNEVKRILLHVCKGEKSEEEAQKNFDAAEVKELVYVGIKIMHKAIGSDQDNKKEILTMNGIVVLNDIITFLLNNSFTRQTLTFDTKEAHQQSENSSVVILTDRVEAKTINFCVKGIMQLLQEDIQSFVDLPLENRIFIF